MSTSYLDSRTDSQSAEIIENENDSSGLGYVQIQGAVRSPGVYEIEGDTRLFEIVEKAGGLTEDAAYERINQAKQVSDGESIYIKTQSEADEEDRIAALATENGESSGKININTADEQSLMTLAGIGESKAKMIIEYRTSNGSFTSIEDIMKIQGIKEGVFNKIKNDITVG